MEKFQGIVVTTYVARQSCALLKKIVWQKQAQKNKKVKLRVHFHYVSGTCVKGPEQETKYG